MGRRDRFKLFISHPLQHRSHQSSSITSTSGTELELRLGMKSGIANEPALTTTSSEVVATKDPWAISLEKLSTEEKSLLLQIKSDSKIEILESVQAAAK